MDVEISNFDIIILSEAETSIELVFQIRNLSKKILILMITDNLQSVIKTISFYPILYVRNQNLKNDLLAIKAVLLNVLKKTEYFELSNELKIPLKDILCFEVQNNRIGIYTNDKKVLYIKGKLKDISNKSFNDYCMINRSVIVNVTYVNKIDYPFVYLENNLKFEISRRRKKVLQFYLKEMNQYHSH